MRVPRPESTSVGKTLSCDAPDEPALPSSVASYEELEGGQGREIFFRPDRYRTAELGLEEPVARVTTRAGTHACALVDISQNGLAFRCPEELAIQPGDRIERIVVELGGQEAYRGDARVISVRAADLGRLVGVALTEAPVSIEDVLALRDIKVWAREDGQRVTLAGRPWFVSGYERFKSLVSELRLFLLDAQKQLASLEASLPFHVVHGEGESPARAALIESLRRELVVPIVRYSEQIDAAIRGAPPKDLQALKEFSLRQVQEFLLQSPWMHRALHKPLGYPGDFRVMRHVYEDSFSGPSLFAKTLSLAFLETAPARAVRARKDFVRRQLADRLGAGRSTPYRVLSVAAGPAQEIYELLTGVDDLDCRLNVVLFDQERQALSYAYGRLQRVVESRWPKQVKILYRYDTIKRLLRERDIFGDCGPFDFIFACGLFDYLNFTTAARLCANLERCLVDGGTMLVGNMVPWNPGRWFMELHLDWHLTYRTHEEMLAFARMGASRSRCEILEEETGINPFVCLTKGE
jgi:extracellular factor (EF) 3-hydroxypalmitic acid methyl ester biosynthesis protein